MKEPSVLWTSLEAAVITGGRNSGEWRATGVCLNTQNVQPGDLFFAAPGDNLEEVFLKGAAAAVVAGGAPEREGWPILRVPDVFAALQSLARAARFKTHAEVIAVQGAEARKAIGAMLSGFFDVHTGGRHLSLGLAGIPETAEFAVFGFSPIISPDIAVITDCANVDGSVFETMQPGSRVLIHADGGQVADVVARARAAGVRNIFTFGQAADADVTLLEILHASNGARARLRILGEETDVILPPGKTMDTEMLAGALILRLSETPVSRIAQVLSGREEIQNPLQVNVTLLDRLIMQPAQAAFRVVNMIDMGYGGQRTVVLGNVGSPAGALATVSNKDVAIPLRIDNLNLVYASKGVSLLSNAESAIQETRPFARLEKIVPAVLAPGDFLTFSGFLNGPKNIIAGALRNMSTGVRKPVKADHAL